MCENALGIFENEQLMEHSNNVAKIWFEMYGHHVYETVVFDGPVLE